MNKMEQTGNLEILLTAAPLFCMKKIVNFVLAIAMLVALAIIFTGCGDNGDYGQEIQATTTISQTETPSTTQELSGIDLEIAC